MPVRRGSEQALPKRHDLPGVQAVAVAALQDAKKLAILSF